MAKTKKISELSKDYLRKLPKEEIEKRLALENINQSIDITTTNIDFNLNNVNNLVSFKNGELEEEELFYNQISILELLEQQILKKLLEEGVTILNQYGITTKNPLIAEYLSIIKEKNKLITQCKEIINIQKEGIVIDNDYNDEDLF